LAAEKVINLANEVFGFNGWSSGVQNVHIDYVEEKEGRISMSCSVIVRVTLKDGTYHEDVGCGSIENSKTKAAAFEKVKKEAATDALKRALRNFGNVLGNCLYDKDYLSRVTKLKLGPTKWHEDNLHRHPSYEPIRKQAISDTSGEKDAPAGRASNIPSAHTDGTTDYEEYDGLLDEIDFEHPDEVRLNDTGVLEVRTDHTNSRPQTVPTQTRQDISRVQSMPTMRETNRVGPPLHNQQQSRPPDYQGPHQVINGNGHIDTKPIPVPTARRTMPPAVESIQGHRPPIANRPNISKPPPQNYANSSTSEPTVCQTKPLQNNAGPEGYEVPVGFITGRAAETLQKSEATNSDIPRKNAFNPHAQSPSIRRTSGIDHNTSQKVTHIDIIKAKVQQQQQQQQQQQHTTGPPSNAGPNFVNPQTDPARRIGMPPVAGQSPVANRGQYKPPGPAVGAVAGLKRGRDGTARQPLADVSNGQVVQITAYGTADGLDSKKVKVGT
jgi:DNA repair and recombination protein RAD52